MIRQIFFSFFGREPFYSALSLQATAKNTVEYNHESATLATSEAQQPGQVNSHPLDLILEQQMESDDYVEPVKFELHPPGSPPVPSRLMEVDAPIADRFKDSSSIAGYNA